MHYHTPSRITRYLSLPLPITHCLTLPHTTIHDYSLLFTQTLTAEVTAQKTTIDKLLDEVMRAPRREETLRRKFDHDLRMNNIEMGKRDTERRRLKEEAKTMLYWRHKAERAEAHFFEYVVSLRAWFMLTLSSLRGPFLLPSFLTVTSHSH